MSNHLSFLSLPRQKFIRHKFIKLYVDDDEEEEIKRR